jgi:hypothetical protein
MEKIGGKSEEKGEESVENYCRSVFKVSKEQR